MTTTSGRSRTRGRVLVSLLTIGFALCAVAPAHAGQTPARHHGHDGHHRGHGHDGHHGPGHHDAHHGHHGPGGPATAEIVDSTQRGGKAVALTFDDGPDPDDTPRLLGVLREHRVKAVFCLWGEHVRQHPEIVRRIAAAGHTLCNHTMRHDDMSTWSPADIRADLRATNDAIRDAVPHARIPYFRAPYGAWGQTPEVSAELGMQPLGWSLAVEDWVPPGTDELVRRLEEGITPRSVVLLHDGGGDRSQTVAAVDRIIPGLRADGWHFARPARRG
ncbi:polysaccharide deacetylase family protein [Streptomonospora litoralis]|uniref:Peptidoglycan-N-acetylglucosamine deacetylase n=1 Tax=Streptomonospora litoralis TaxID=2498135 RepID=A0A4P6Q6E7_9ACTN|nr:polysaccharide deacetylase family protein [Streptomonospora litoralis]QBI54961.1 Peptidoglycan-N-acetylglucosamine deacetylase [Streptomonospora litoralis]